MSYSACVTRVATVPAAGWTMCAWDRLSVGRLSAALGVAQYRQAPSRLIPAKRERVAKWYDERLAHIEGIHPPYIPPYTTR